MQIPLTPNLYLQDRESFLARYREQTGLTVEQVNPQVVEYFMMLGTARLMAQMLQSLEALPNGESRGVMATYLINALSLLYNSSSTSVGAWDDIADSKKGPLMIGRPTTDQILLDCARALMEEVLPAITDETVQICGRRSEGRPRLADCATLGKHAARRCRGAYNRAGEVLSVGLEVAVSADVTELRHRGEQLLELRLERELVIMAGWKAAGR